MKKYLQINIFDYKLIVIGDIEKYKDLNYKMYAILSFEIMYLRTQR